ncbi:MAG: HTH-type transcriptional regulator, bacterioopsin transcriptional activator [Thermoplasmata archaeon]|nr:HTH-type transcriptional regulator, bacterioopsin transcriptional activator [Thermoplasmata archaeon]
MTFTELVVEIGDARSPLVQLTRPPDGAFALVRILDDGQASRRMRVLLACHGPASHFDGLARDLRALRPQDDVEVAYASESFLGLLLTMPCGEGPAALGFLGLPAVLREAGLDGLLDPIVVRGGRARIRVLVARPVDPPEALRALQAAQRALGAPDFRVARVGSIQPAEVAHLVRRMLPPEQEELLRLAASLGYYDTPKRSTLEGIAAKVGLSISPVHKRLKAAEETLVCAHVQPAPRASSSRRRGRADHASVGPAQPWEITVRVRAPDFGSAAFTHAAPGSSVVLVPASEDRLAGTTRHLLIAHAPDDAGAKLVAGLQGRPEVSHVQVVARERGTLVARIEARGRVGYGMAWWSEVWGGDAVLRPILFEGDDAILRILLVRPHTEERLLARLADAARAGHWVEHDVLHARALGEFAAPPEMGEPLTGRQLEVLRVAHALGYYQTPRGTTLEGVAKTLGVSANAIHKNLVLAESKIISAYLGASF